MEPLPRTGEPSLQWQLGFLHWRELEPRAGIRISQTLMRSIRRTSRILAEIRLKSRWVGVRVAQHFPQMTGAPMALQCSQGKRPAHEHQLQRGRQGSAPQKASPSRSLSETRRTEAMPRGREAWPPQQLREPGSGDQVLGDGEQSLHPRTTGALLRRLPSNSCGA